MMQDTTPTGACVGCGGQADTTCDWGYHVVHGTPCHQPLCWGCAVVMEEKEGGDVWCRDHAAHAALYDTHWQRIPAPGTAMTSQPRHLVRQAEMPSFLQPGLYP
jgi:hypothetical protein